MEEPIYMPPMDREPLELVFLPEGDGSQESVSVADPVAVIVPFTADMDDEPAALWGIVLNGAVTFVGGTENYAAVVTNIHSMLQDLAE